MNVVENVAQVFQTYMGTTMFLSIFWVCIIYVFCHGNGNGRKRLLFLLMLGILFLFNDLSLRVMGKLTDISTYYRFLWAIPILPLIAWAGTKTVMERRKFWERAVVVVLLLALFRGGMSSFLTKDSLRMPANLYNLSEDVMRVCDIIEQDKQKEQPVVAFDLECQMMARLYNPSLVWGISRRAYQEHDNAEGYEDVKKSWRAQKSMIRAVNHGMKDDAERLSRALERKQVDYIVTLNVYEMGDYLAGMGYGLVDSTGNRSIYARTEE